MAWSLQWYKNSVLAWLWNEEAQQAIQRETPWFDMFSNVNTNNVPWMDILDPVSRQRQQYDQNQMRIEALNKEVETWLWTRIDDVMSDKDKQYYLNHLNKNQYEQMLKFKNEWYWFMASKALLENQYKLADANASGLMKYKDYADKDVYYTKNANTTMSSIWDKYVANPIWKLANYWNNSLWYGEDAQKGNMSFADRFANLTLWNIINWLDTYANAESRILNTTESWWRALYDKVVKGYDTDWDFYDKDREEHIVDEVIDAVYGAWQSAMWWLWLLPWALPVTAWLSTKPWEVIWGITLGWLSKAIDWTLDNVPLVKQAYNMLSEDSRDKLSTGVAMAVVGRVAKWGKAKLDAKAEPYIATAKGMLENWLKKAWEYAQVQRGFEEFQWTKEVPFVDMETWEVGTVSEFEWFKPWYRWRIAKEAWEWFKEGIRERMNTEWTTLSEWESTVYQEWIPWTEQTSWVSEGVKTDTNGTQTNWIVNRIWTAQLRQWNKMNKSQAIKFSNKYGTDYGNWLAQRWFNQAYENNINALIDYADYTQWQKSQVLWTITQRYRDPAIDDMLTDALEKAEYIKSPDLWKLESLALKNEQWGLTLQDADWLRQWFWYNFPLRFDGTDVSGTVARNNNMYTAMREFLEAKAAENWFPQLRELNREIAATHHIIEATTRRYNGIATNDTVSLKDLVTLAWAMANPNAWPLFMLQQALKSTKVQDRILSKLIKWKTNSERNQIKIDLEKIKKIQDAAEQRRLLEEWIAKWNLKVEQATIWVDKILPENIVTDPNSGNWWGIEATDTFTMPEPVKAPGEIGVVETYSPKVLLKAMIEQLEVMNLIEKVNSSAIADYILKNLSPEAQQRLGEIAQKLSKGRMLTEEDSQVVQKLADVIRHQQDWLKGLDNGEPTGYNPTDLPTNPTNNGGITEWGNPWEWGLWEVSWWSASGKTKANGGTNWWGNKEWGGEWVNDLWTPKGTDWASKEIIELLDVDEAYQVIDNLLWNSEYRLSSPSERWWYRTFTNGDRNAAISIDWDWNIVEFIQSDNAPQWAADELLLHAIEQWGKKIDVDYNSVWLIKKLKRFWFYPLSKAWWWDGKKYYLAHNWDPIDTIRQNINWYNIDERLSHIKWFDTYREAAEYRNEFIKDNEWYKLTDEEWWDWLKNYKEFSKRFKTQADIKKYIDDTFKGVDSHVSNDIEDLFNKTLAMSRQVYNWNKNTKDLSIIYALLSELPKNVLWRYWRPTNELTFGKEWFTAYHELTHYSNYFWWKELTGSEVELTAIANQIKNRKRPKNIDIRAELIWDFAEIFKEIDKRAWHWDDVASDKTYEGRPSEIFSRRWEAFYSDVQWKWLVSTDWEMFPRKISTMYAKWLWKVNIARAKWELYDWTLQEISNLVRRKVALSIPWVWNVRWMKVWILKDWKTVWIKDVELSQNTDRRWFHGSSAKFDKFDSSHMWEWEGNQAHGWWHYIAIRKWTAEWYAKLKETRYGTYDFTIDWVPYRDVYKNLSSEEQDIFDWFKAAKVNDWSVEEAWKRVENQLMDAAQYKLAKKILSELPEKRANNPQKPKEYYDEIEDDVKSYIDKYERFQSIIDSMKERVGTSSNMYEVEFPDPVKADTPTWKNYLEEKWLMSALSVQEFIKEFSDRYPEKAEQFKANIRSNSATRYWELEWREIYTYLVDALWTPKAASKFLESIWYDWIHYFGNRDGEAYVIFGDDSIDIKNHKSL